MTSHLAPSATIPSVIELACHRPRHGGEWLEGKSGRGMVGGTRYARGKLDCLVRRGTEVSVFCVIQGLVIQLRIRV